MNKQELIKRIAASMIEKQKHSRHTKSGLRQVMQARFNKKKIPDVKPRAESKPNKEFKKLSIEEYEKKYPTFEN